MGVASNTRELLSEDAFNSLPQGFRSWVVDRLEWKREEISHITVNPPTGNYTDVSVFLERDTHERWCARFRKLNNGDWKFEEDYNVTPFPGRDEVNA